MTHSHPKPHNYKFRSKLIAGVTPVRDGNIYDYLIERPFGMKGYTIHLTIEGCGEIQSGGSTYMSKKGDMYMFPTNIPHHYCREKQSASWVHLWVYFHPRIYWMDLLDWDKLSGGILHFSIPPEKYQCFTSLFNQLAECSKKMTAHMNLLAFNILEQILLRRIEITENENCRILDERVINICRYVEENIFNSTLTVDEIARHINLSRSRTLHVFREQMGISIIKWRDEQRIIYARKLLLDSRLSINEIANKVGYEDPVYFSKVFKKRTGISPRDFRNDAFN